MASRADIEVEDAESLVEDFGKSISGFVDRRTWEVINQITPIELEEVEVGNLEDGERTMKRFLLEMSQEEELSPARAARHARAVAETIREHATAEQVRELDQALDEDFLALFESRGRGELTGVEVPETWSEVG